MNDVRPYASSPAPLADAYDSSATSTSTSPQACTRQRTGSGVNSTIERHFDFLKRVCYLFAILKGICYPIFKVSLVALAEKLLREALRNSLDSTAYETILDEIYAPALESTTTGFYLMYNLSFYQNFTVTILLIIAVAVFMSCQDTLEKKYLNHMEVKRLQGLIYNHVLLQASSFDTSDVQDLVFTKINAVEAYWSEAKYDVIDDFASMLVGLILFLGIAWDLGLMTMCASAISTFIALMVWKRLSTPWAAQHEAKLSLVNERLMDLVVCHDVVLSHTMEMNEKQELEKLMRSDEVEIKHLVMAHLLSNFLEYCFFPLLMPLLFLFVYLTDLGIDRVFQLLLIILVNDELIRAYLSFLRKKPQIEEYERAVEAICCILRKPTSEVFPRDFHLWPPSNCCLSSLRRPCRENVHNNDAKNKNTNSRLCSGGKISMNNVGLGYTRKDGTTSVVMKNISLEFVIGSRYALLGETGVGKSTVLKVMAGLIPTLSGNILISGEPIDATTQSWRSQVAVVSQDSVFFNRSLRDNLSYGLDQINDEQIMAALGKVRLQEMVQKLTDGLDTVLTKNGNELSGGQRQRLQIARLLLRQKPIVLLDEMTSALDTRTKKSIITVLKEYTAEKTMLMVTHDLETLELATTVMEMHSTGEWITGEVKQRPIQLNRESSRRVRPSLGHALSGRSLSQGMKSSFRDLLHQANIPSFRWPNEHKVEGFQHVLNEDGESRSRKLSIIYDLEGREGDNATARMKMIDLFQKTTKSDQMSDQQKNDDEEALGSTENEELAPVEMDNTFMV